LKAIPHTFEINWPIECGLPVILPDISEREDTHLPGAKKPISAMIASSELPQFRLDKFLGPWSMVAIGIGATIGAGIYVLAGFAASGVNYPIPSTMDQPLFKVLWQLAHGALPGAGLHSTLPAGPAVALSFLLIGLVCFLIGLCYAELASLMPLAGSVYTYSYAALGEATAWIAGWILVLEYGLGTVVIATALGNELKARLTGFHILMPNQWSLPVWSEGKWTGAYFNVPSFCLVIAVTIILSRGIRAFSRINAVMVVLKCGAILFFIVLGSTFVHPANWRPFAPGGMSSILSAGIILFFAFVGFDCVSVAAEESKRPERDAPVGILGSVAICSVFYIAATFVLLGIVPYALFQSAAAPSKPAALYALQRSGVATISQSVVSAGMLIGLFSVMFVLQYGQTRLWYAMSRDGMVPEVFSSVDPKTRTPRWSVWIWGATVALCAGLINVGEASDLVAIGTLMAFAMASICVIVLRRNLPKHPRRFKVPWSPWLPLASLAATLVMMSNLALITWLRFLAWLGIGFVIYLAYCRHRNKLCN
jgi:APA family basic amino acid/polyamine antiporter